MDSRLQRLQQQQQAAAQSSVPRRQRFAAQVISSANESLSSSSAATTEKNEATAPEPEQHQTASKLKPEQEVLKASESSTSSSELSSDDEDIKELLKKPSRPLLKPVFVPKELRGQSASAGEALFASELTHDREESRLLAADIIKRDFEAEMNASSTDSLRADPLTGAFDPASVDDTDDPALFEEEYLAWRLRELLRIKEERDERERWDREREELERIRNMTEEERRKLDAEKQAQWEATASGQYKFLQKYYHKGAFYQDEHREILSRDYTAPTGSDRTDKDVLPEFMQVRNFGKKGRSKWKHLTAEDTTAFDYGWGAKDNPLNQSKISQMGGMRGDLDHPSKKSKK